jgi:hypothetical protein
MAYPEGMRVLGYMLEMRLYGGEEMTCNDIALFWITIGGLLALFGIVILMWHVINDKVKK